MSHIHPTAVVEEGAVLGDGVRVGPYAFIQSGAVVGDGTVVEAHAVITSWVRMGKNNYVGYGAVLGGDPQDISFRGWDSYVVIGDNNTIREFVTIHRASREGEATVVGSNCYIMAYSHIAHDCLIGDGVIVTNYAGISGFVEIRDRAIVSGHVGIHQFVRIGELAFISGGSFPGQDIPPYCVAAGRPAKVVGLNVVGMRRAGISPEARLQIKRAFDIYFRRGLSRSHAIEIIEKELDSEEVRRFVEFVKTTKRGVAAFAKEG